MAREQFLLRLATVYCPAEMEAADLSHLSHFPPTLAQAMSTLAMKAVCGAQPIVVLSIPTYASPSNSQQTLQLFRSLSTFPATALTQT